MNNFKENEDNQKKMEENNISRGSVWQGDLMSDLIFKLSKRNISDKVLDVGAGTGALINTINNNGFSAIGIDLCPKEDLIQQGVITNLPFEDSEFKTVFCTEVLEHLTDDQIEKGLSEVNRVLRSGGNFIITTPFKEDLTNGNYNCPDCNKVFHPFGHIQSFTEERIKNLFENKGFRIISQQILPLHLMAKLPYSTIYYKLLRKLIDKMGYTRTLFVIAEKKDRQRGKQYE